MSDLVINVKQIGSYPPLNPVTGSEVLICQSGGLGGPYYSVTMQNMIVNTLSNFGGPVGIGVGSLPTDAAGDTLFSGDIVALPGILGYAFNAYRYNTSGSKYWQTGPAGMFEMDASTGTLNWFAAPTQQGGMVIDQPGVTPGGTGSLWYNTMSLTQQGMLNVGQQITVARNANAAMELVTYGQFNSTVSGMVSSWNGRFGVVTMTLADITSAGGAGINSPYFTGIPMAPTPALGTNNDQIATTAWVLNQISSVTAGVVSWNGRSGVVTMTQSDITNAGGLTSAIAQATFLPLSGGTMTGAITLTSAANQNMEVPVLGQVGARVGASTPPATPAPVSGQLWWDSNGAQLYAWTGQQWVVAVNPPIPNTANFLPITGGTVTGPLQVQGQLTTTTQVATGTFTTSGNIVQTGTSTIVSGGNINGAGFFASGNSNFSGNLTITGGGGQPLWLQNGSVSYNFQVTPSTGNPANAFYIQSNQFTGGWAFSLLPNLGGEPQAQFNVNTVWIAGNASPALVIQNFGGGVNWGLFNAGNALAIMPASGTGQPSGTTRYLYCNANIGWLQTGVSMGPENDNNAYCGGGGGGSWTSVGAYAFTQASDPRDKKDIAPAPSGALDKVKTLGVINYRTIPPTDADPTKHMPEYDQLRTGFDATEVLKVHPDAVTMDEDGTNPRGYSLSDMNALLWQAVQELCARVEVLEGAR